MAWLERLLCLSYILRRIAAALRFHRLRAASSPAKGRKLIGPDRLLASRFLRRDFMAIDPALVRDLDGDMNAAAILVRVEYRQNSKFCHVDDDGVSWWRVSLAELGECTGLSEQSAGRAVKKLVDGGLLIKEKFQLGGPWDQTWSYRIAEPVPSFDTEDSTDRVSPSFDTEASASFDTEASHPSIPKLLPYEKNKEEVEEERTLIPADAATDLVLPGLLSDRLPSEVDVGDAFEEWWKLYPRKVGKGGARRSYERVVRKKLRSIEELTDDMVRFAAKVRADLESGSTELRFVPHAQTWLNNERWSDQVVESPVGQPRRRGDIDWNAAFARAADRDASLEGSVW